MGDLSNGHFWPILAVLAMKFTRGRPTATFDPEPTFEPLVHRMLVHQSYNDNQLLAFGSNIAQDARAIFVLACLSASCPFSGHSFQVIHNTQIVRFRARFVRGIFYGGQNGYWNSKVF